MTDEAFKILIAIIGTFISIGVSYIANAVSSIGKKQQGQEISFAEMKGQIDAMQSSLNGLHSWRNRMQEKEFRDMEQQIKDLREGKGV
jgi:hypothetical protein